uniref:ATP synthase F0 subunit 8 n=1 Tax=Paurocephala sauteri TaxID=2768670 RepID=A0A7L9R594_9HEMI|nr:ATP synthase F0 subunit 8 [Paurocephala sauteri]QOL10530.1 ATP synthase F0 subunit 8 [Paurocephala sauteri]
MPQMSPMPWILIMFLTMLTLFMIINYIYFYKNTVKFYTIKSKKYFKLIKW